MQPFYLQIASAFSFAHQLAGPGGSPKNATAPKHERGNGLILCLVAVRPQVLDPAQPTIA